MVGMLHFWGITVDTLSCINIVLAIGLCVDYSAHIAHAFIVAEGEYLIMEFLPCNACTQKLDVNRKVSLQSRIRKIKSSKILTMSFLGFLASSED